MAADSRAIGYDLSGHKSDSDDTQCKIGVFDDNTIFAMIGDAGYNPVPGDKVVGWKTIDVARMAVQRANLIGGDVHARVQSMADAWVQSVWSNWTSLNKWHPDQVRRMARLKEGMLAAGIFAVVKDGILDSRPPVIGFDEACGMVGWKVTEITSCWTCGQKVGSKVCAGGPTEVAEKFCSGTAEARNKSIREWVATKPFPKDIDTESILAMRIAELTIERDKSGTVGGNVDAVELNKDGVHWWQRKDNCPERSN